VKDPLHAYTSARQHWEEGTIPEHLLAEVADGSAMTIFNPLTIAYWVGVTTNWLPFAHSVLGNTAPGWGIVMATAGMMTWFTALIVVVRFIPQRMGPIFFRLVNTILGLILLGFATFCAIVLSRHPAGDKKVVSGIVIVSCRTSRGNSDGVDEPFAEPTRRSPRFPGCRFVARPILGLAERTDCFLPMPQAAGPR
jgi:hypothetical protein